MNKILNQLTENEIAEFVSIYFQKNDYTVKKLEGFLVAFKQGNSKCCIVVKGGASNIKGTKKYKKPFNNNQIKQNIGVALLKSFQIKEIEDIKVFIAVPDEINYCEIYETIKNILVKTDIKFLFVKHDGSVEEK